MKRFTLLLSALFFTALISNAQKDSNLDLKPAFQPKKPHVNMNHISAKGPLVENFEGAFPATGWSLPAGDDV